MKPSTATLRYRSILTRYPKTIFVASVVIVLVLWVTIPSGEVSVPSGGRGAREGNGGSEPRISSNNNGSISKPPMTAASQKLLLQPNSPPDVPSVGQSLLSDQELQELLDNIKGDDNRLFRWDATAWTVQRRKKGGCEKLDEVIVSVLLRLQEDSSPSTTTTKSLAAEFLTFCITDSPRQRENFSGHEGIHQAVVDLVASTNAYLSSLASHLIYIASFANQLNHQTFIQSNAVQALANVVMNKNSLTSQSMWAAAALQNLAASYCETENDGRCYWRWTSEESHVVVSKRCLPMISDGSNARKQILEIPGLVEQLIAMACTGPVKGKASDNNIFPGSNAILGRDDNNPHLVAWAATGALKNLALEPSSQLSLEPALICMCHLKNSPDWLEELKSDDLIRFVRRGDPCWFRGKKENQQPGFCIDGQFFDQEGYHCGDYQVATQEECLAKDVNTQIPAKQACCGCDGGTFYPEDDEGS
ncbi:hypothetical protein ACA910_000871 [Epithemia clementina (nom. ined.)]